MGTHLDLKMVLGRIGKVGATADKKLNYCSSYCSGHGMTAEVTNMLLYFELVAKLLEALFRVRLIPLRFHFDNLFFVNFARVSQL